MLLRTALITIIVASACSAPSTTDSGAPATDDAGQPGCGSPQSCPGLDTDCAKRTCTAGVCGTSFAARGTPASSQPGGDCRTRVCDGEGEVMNVADDQDVPAAQVCARTGCANGTPTYAALDAGVACGAGTLCDGRGLCVGCLVASDCPGTDRVCSRRQCLNRVCGVALTARGTVLPTQTSGDCQELRCDGDGGIAAAALDTDAPDSGTACTRRGCLNGVQTSSLLDAGTACGNGLVCTGQGACVGCLTAGDCPGTDSECQARACVMGMCTALLRDAGVVVASQRAGDCRENRCDGLGGVISAVHDVDTPDGGDVCRQNLCASGTPSFPPQPSGTACGGSNVCDGQGACVTTGPTTYANDARPIFAAKCAPCHTTGSSGGHNIGAAYADSQLASAVCAGLTKGACALVRIKNGSMPFGAGCSGNPVADVGNAACLSASQQTTLERWVDGGQLP